MVLWRTLVEIKLRETWNDRIRFNRSGLLMILLELVTLISLFVGMRVFLNDVGRGLKSGGDLVALAALTLPITFGNGYLLAERMLFGFKARVDRLMAMYPQEIIKATVVTAYLANLRPTLQIPTLMALALARVWFPHWQLELWVLYFLIPLIGTGLALLVLLVVKRFFLRLSGLLLIVTPFLQIAGLAVALWLGATLVKGKRVKVWVSLNLPELIWWIPVLLAVGGVILYTGLKSAALWEKAFLEQEERGTGRLGKKPTEFLLKLLSVFRLPAPAQAVILKEWLFLWRNPLTTIRILAWLILSLLPLINSWLGAMVNGLSPLIPTFAIWYFCFGELIATAYQAEGRRIGLFWLAAISPGQLATGKFLAYLPLTFFAGVTAGLMNGVIGLKGPAALLSIIFSILGTTVGLALSLIPAGLTMNKVDYAGSSLTDMAMEQVPLTFYSFLSALLMGGILVAFYFIVSLTPWPGAVLGVVVAGSLGVAMTGYFVKRRYNL
ncbi:hypothetical protein [Carboxydothermus islandicus]|nr:hypothetical protein [Carboxydothermus islandicus]